ncbi:hypothetical protein [Acidocella sp.]|jgi:hypothetical protein|uniref:hypothetical protein n=1 Tax=Acidocella sp. TaxID=50710 RepID=UPI002F417AD7
MLDQWWRAQMVGEIVLVTPGGKTFTAFGEPFSAGEVVGGFIVDHVEGRTCWLRLPQTKFEEDAHAAWLNRSRS